MTVLNCSDCEGPIVGSGAWEGTALLCMHCRECPDRADCAEDPCPNVTPSITCPKCSMTSYHPDDIRYGWCGNCNDYTSKAKS